MRARMISRRKFLKETLFGAAFLTAAKLLPTGVLQAKEFAQVPTDLLYFSPKEYLVIEAASMRLIGAPSRGQPGSSDIGVASRADRYLAGADPEVQDQIHQLLTVFNASLFTFLLDFRLSSFLNMSPEDQDLHLRSWMSSNLGFRRTGFQALKRLCLSMFYTDSRTWSEIGYEGMFMPEDRR